MDNKINHADQYKMLREEIMQNIREIGRIESVCAAAVGGIYTWLFTHKTEEWSYLVWWIVPWIMTFCAVRILYFTFITGKIAEYLQLIEKASFDDVKLPGWENNIKNSKGKLDKVLVSLAAIYWLLSISASIYLALFKMGYIRMNGL